VKKEIKNVQGFIKGHILNHDYFFNDMRHWTYGCQ